MWRRWHWRRSATLTTTLTGCKSPHAAMRVFDILEEGLAVLHPGMDSAARRARLEKLTDQVGLHKEALERFPMKSWVGAHAFEACESLWAWSLGWHFVPMNRIPAHWWQAGRAHHRAGRRSRGVAAPAARRHPHAAGSGAADARTRDGVRPCQAIIESDSIIEAPR